MRLDQGSAIWESGVQRESSRLEKIMVCDVVCIDMDYTIAKAIACCSEKRIRHLPVLDEGGRLAGLVTDRDLRKVISPRLGTISENKSDRESTERPVHLMMVREVVTAWAWTSLAEAAQLMLRNRVGCLPIVDENRHVVGIVTTTDFLRYTAQGQA